MLISFAISFTRPAFPAKGLMAETSAALADVTHVSYQGEDCLTWPFSRFGYGTIYGHKHAHRVMCELAYGPAPSPRHQVAHSCGKGHEGCVNPRHLRWATPKENSADMVLHGTALRGERAINVKLTTPEVHAVKMFGEWGFRGFDTHVRAALDKAAKEDKRPTSSLIQKVMEDWLKAEWYLE
jgi:hypothetical protein